MNVRKYIAHLLVTCLVLLSSSGAGQAQQPVNSSRLKSEASARDVVRSLEKTIPRLMKEADVPGLYVVLILNSGVYWHRGFGVKHVDTKAPIDDATVFETASLTKPVFAYAVLKLVDSGKLDLDTPLAKYLPKSFIEGDPRFSLITARMVLSHTTGLQNELYPGERLQIHFTPGERFSYSGEGYIYLQKVVEHVTGMRLDALMEKLVFGPLGMRSASYTWRDDYEGLMANGHNAAGIVAERIKPSDVKLSWLHMTPLDYSKFVIAVMNGVGLKASTAKLMQTTQVRMNEGCTFCLTPGTGRVSQSLSWGLGWGLERTEAGTALWHWGENRGEFQTFALAYPKEKLGIIVFTNSGNGFSILPKIVSEAIGGRHPALAWMGYEPYDTPAKKLTRELLSRGEAAINQYRQSRKSPSATVILSEIQMNSLGYWLLAKKRSKEAIEIFRMNVEDFPHSSNAYDSLGEAYMLDGDKELAIRNYQRSLELNPNNRNAVEMIKKLQNQ